MKKNLFFAVAALAALTFTSCSKEDNNVTPAKPATTVISFENQTLGAEGYWCGDLNGVKYDSWGVDGYACQYQESGVTFPVNYTPAYASWSGFAISNRTATNFKPAASFSEINADQFNNIVGKAFDGNNYCVVYTFGEGIEFKEGVVVKGFYYTNNAWTVDAILNGDGMTEGNFTKEDWLKCTIAADKADGTTATVELVLAANGDYIKDWQYADLSSLGKITKLSFSFDGTKKNDYGLTTPTYICIDNIVIEK